VWRAGTRGPNVLAFTNGRWLDSVPGPVVLLLAVVVAALVTWGVFARSGPRLKRGLREDDLHPVTGRILAALPAPVTKALTLALAAGMVAYGVSRVV
jgi:hypothetical protein